MLCTRAARALHVRCTCAARALQAKHGYTTVVMVGDGATDMEVRYL